MSTYNLYKIHIVITKADFLYKQAQCEDNKLDRILTEANHIGVHSRQP